MDGNPWIKKLKNWKGHANRRAGLPKKKTFFHVGYVTELLNFRMASDRQTDRHSFNDPPHPRTSPIFLRNIFSVIQTCLVTHNRPPFINHAQLTSQLLQSHAHTRPIDPPRELRAYWNRPIIVCNYISISMHTLVHSVEITNSASQPFNQHLLTHTNIHTYR